MFHVMVATLDQVANGYVGYVIRTLKQAQEDESAEFRAHRARGMTFKSSEMLVYCVGIGGPDWVIDLSPNYEYFFFMNDAAKEFADKVGLQYEKIRELSDAELALHRWPEGIPLCIRETRTYLT
jgi:predicted ABC-type transport system involved in lysophospholipase L1 biosynthesis ATPase subunit